MGKFTFLFMTIAGGYALFTAIPPGAALASKLASVGSTPVATRVADAPSDRWITLTDAKLRCETRSAIKDETTYFLATDAALASPFVAQFLGSVTCEAAQEKVSGVFLAGTLTLADLTAMGLETRGATGLRHFSPFGTPRYLKARLVPFAVVAVIGLAMALFGLRGLLRKSGDDGR